MFYFISIGSQFKKYNELTVARAIDKKVEWTVISIDANKKLSQLADTTEDTGAAVIRICEMFRVAPVLDILGSDAQAIYVYDLISCAGPFWGAFELIKAIRGHEFYRDTPVYYRHGNTLYSEHPEEFSLVNAKVIGDYHEFQSNPRLAKGILALFAAKVAIADGVRPVSYAFMEQIWNLKALARPPFDIERFIDYLAGVELQNIAATFMAISADGELSATQKEKIFAGIYGVVGDYSNLMRK